MVAGTSQRPRLPTILRTIMQRQVFPALFGRLLGRLRFPQLFLLTGALFLLDLVIPDLIPFVDEVLLGLLTYMLSQLKRPESGEGGEGDRPPEKNVTPKG